MLDMTHRSLRHCAALATALLASALVAGCREKVGPIEPDAETIAKATITARPSTPSIQPTIGYSQLGLATPRDGFMYVPSTYSAATAAPLIVLLHGAGGTDDIWESSASIANYAETHGMIILATESRYSTWDGPFLGRYDVDVAFLNSALLHVFERVNVDETRVTIGGFSDGAAEALGIGVANAGLFRKIIAFTPSQLLLPFSRGNPEIFISHGNVDPVVPFANSRDFVVPLLRGNGMTVEFWPFEGGHDIPSTVEAAAFTWLFE
jgi:phospholipase/carboxylesterase